MIYKRPVVWVFLSAAPKLNSRLDCPGTVGEWSAARKSGGEGGGQDQEGPGERCFSKVSGLWGVGKLGGMEGDGIVDIDGWRWEGVEVESKQGYANDLNV